MSPARQLGPFHPTSYDNAWEARLRSVSQALFNQYTGPEKFWARLVGEGAVVVAKGISRVKSFFFGQNLRPFWT